MATSAGPHRDTLRSGARVARRAAGAVVILLLPFLPVGVAAEQPTDIPPSLHSDAVKAFFNDPVRNMATLRAAIKGGINGLTALELLAVADGKLRAGDVNGAAKLFGEALARNPPEPLTSFAGLGLGWAALAQNDYARARDGLARAAGDVASGQVAAVLTAWLDAIQYPGPEAIAVLDALAVDKTMPQNVREVAYLGRGYARYWTGDFAGALAAFNNLLDIHSDGPLGDDALYGTAWATYHTGDTAEAVRLLKQAAGLEESAGGDPLVSAGVRDLKPAALLRNVRRGTRKAAATRDLSQRFIMTMSGNGRASARTALLTLHARGQIADGDLPPDLLERVIRKRAQLANLSADQAARAAAAPAGSAVSRLRAAAGKVAGLGLPTSADRALRWAWLALAAAAALAVSASVLRRAIRR